MKITITRSFSATKQLKPYEPIDAYCSATMEYELPKEAKETFGSYDIACSEKLDQFCRAEVKKTLEEITANASRKPDQAKIKDVSMQEVIEDIEVE